MTNTIKWPLCLAAIMLAIAVQQFANFPISNAFTRSLNDWMHVPTFALITTVVMYLLPRTNLVILALAITAIALGSEALQFFTNGSPSWNDLIKDALGTGLALLLLRPSTRSKSLGIATVCAVTFAAPCYYLTGNIHQYVVFPALFNPTTVFSRILCHSNSNPKFTEGHSWQRYRNKPVLALRWRETTWPRVYLSETIRDWTQYKSIVIDAYNAESTPQPLTVAVHHLQLLGEELPTRYQVFSLQPGDNRLTAPIAKLAYINNSNSFQIRHLMLNTTQQHAGKRVLLGQIWLE